MCRAMLFPPFADGVAEHSVSVPLLRLIHAFTCSGLVHMRYGSLGALGLDVISECLL